MCQKTFEAGCRQAKKCDRTSFDRLFTSVNDCVESLERLGIDCSEVSKEDVCSDPKDYDGFKATACVRATRSRDCGEDLVPEQCSDVCN